MAFRREILVLNFQQQMKIMRRTHKERRKKCFRAVKATRLKVFRLEKGKLKAHKK